jgi:hypothetical protein
MAGKVYSRFATVDPLGYKFKPELQCYCVLVGWHTSARPISVGQLQQYPPWKKNLWCFLIE